MRTKSKGEKSIHEVITIRVKQLGSIWKRKYYTCSICRKIENNREKLIAKHINENLEIVDNGAVREQ